MTEKERPRRSRIKDKLEIQSSKQGISKHMYEPHMAITNISSPHRCGDDLEGEKNGNIERLIFEILVLPVGLSCCSLLCCTKKFARKQLLQVQVGIMGLKVGSTISGFHT